MKDSHLREEKIDGTTVFEGRIVRLEIVELSAEEAFAAIDSGEIRDCKTAASLLLARRRGYL